MSKISILSSLLIFGAVITLLIYKTSLQKNELKVDKEILKIDSQIDSMKFISQLQEPWNFFTKKVYDDFLDQNVLQSSDFDLDTLFSAQVIRIIKKERIDEELLQLSKYQNLEALSFVECKISSAQFEELIEILKDKKHFKKLMISHSNIKSIPKNILKLKNLQTLGLSHNRITEVNNEIRELPNLKYLGLGKNKSLTKLTKYIGELRSLELLDISGCSLDSIPNSIGQCAELKSLIANAGKLEYVPNSIGNCQKLINLNLGYNQISDFPSEIGSLNNLGVLSISNNLHDSIPVSYKNLKNLFHFN